MNGFVSKDWKSAPISCTCEVLLSVNPVKFCDEATVRVYPASGGGWMALCREHGRKHTEACLAELVIANGEKWK